MLVVPKCIMKFCATSVPKATCQNMLSLWMSTKFYCTYSTSCRLVSPPSIAVQIFKLVKQTIQVLRPSAKCNFAGYCDRRDKNFGSGTTHKQTTISEINCSDTMAPRSSSLDWNGSSSSSTGSFPSSNLVYANLNDVEITVPDDQQCLLNDEHALKEWVWETQKSTLLSSMTISFKDNTAHHIPPSPPPPAAAEPELTVAAVGTTASSSGEEREMVAQKKLALLEKVAHVQQNFLQSEKEKVLYTYLLDGIL